MFDSSAIDKMINFTSLMYNETRCKDFQNYTVDREKIWDDLCLSELYSIVSLGITNLSRYENSDKRFDLFDASYIFAAFAICYAMCFFVKNLTLDDKIQILNNLENAIKSFPETTVSDAKFVHYFLQKKHQLYIKVLRLHEK